MRQIFLFMLFLNVAFFAWQYQKEHLAPVTTQKNVVSGNGVQRLVLVSELDPSEIEFIQQAGSGEDESRNQLQGEQAEQEPMPETEQAPTFVCYSLGPFRNMPDAKEVSLQLSESGVTAVTRETKEKQHKDYWVHLPTENRLTTAQRILQQLEARKISDIYIITLDESQYVISLGVFSLDESAQRRYSQFVSMGYKPVIEDRYRLVTRFWIVVKDNDPSQLGPKIWQNLTDKYPGISRQDNAC